jgi:type I restriction enzyme R subunit
MATGTGKTMLAAALIKALLENRYAERVLFLVDRIELAKQTWEDFQNYLKIYSPTIYNNKKFKHGDILGSSVVISTLQSMMAKKKYRRDFTPFYFDLIINDEAHRSIYGNSREIMEYFNSIRVGLTATPKNYLKNLKEEELSDNKKMELRKLKDTYSNFDCVPGEPTFRYDLIDAVNDPEGPFLVLPKIFDLKTDITNQSLDENGWSINIDDKDYNFKIGQLEKKVFIPERNMLMCQEFLNNAMKLPDGKLGKSIIFTVSKNHAEVLQKYLIKLTQI